jgi:hypothetical protein
MDRLQCLLMLARTGLFQAWHSLDPVDTVATMELQYREAAQKVGSGLDL